MLKKRIIPCLDIRDGRVVKGIQFENIRDAGDPVETARRYSQLGADEITFLDINATHEGRSTMFDVVERTAEQVFIPFTVGGGIRDIDTIREVLRRGADRSIPQFACGANAGADRGRRHALWEPVYRCTLM